MDGVEVKAAKLKKTERTASASSETANNENADDLFYDGKYSKALSVYKKQMNNTDAKKSQQAQLMAARCHLNLGQKNSAIKLLEELAERGSGSPKRQAKRLLKDLEE